MDNKEMFKMLMIDCGDDGGNFTYRADLQRKELCEGVLEFHKNHLNRRIVQYLKVMLVNRMFYNNIGPEEQIVSEYEQDIFGFVSEHGAEKWYTRLDHAAAFAEDFLPTYFKSEIGQENEETELRKNNASYLSVMAEHIKCAVSRQAQVLYLSPSGCTEEAKLTWIASEDGVLSIFTGREMETVCSTPPIRIAAREIELLLRGEICGMLCEIAKQMEIAQKDILSAAVQIKGESCDAKIIRGILAGILPDPDFRLFSDKEGQKACIFKEKEVDTSGRV